MNSQNCVPPPLALNPVTPALLMQLSQHASEQKYEADKFIDSHNNQQSRMDKKGKRRFVSLKPTGISEAQIHENHEQIVQNGPNGIGLGIGDNGPIKNNYEQTLDGFQKYNTYINLSVHHMEWQGVFK